MSVFKLIFPTEANGNHFFETDLYPISICKYAYTTYRYINHIYKYVHLFHRRLGEYYVGIFPQGVVSANFNEILLSVSPKTFFNNELIRVYSSCFFIRINKITNYIFIRSVAVLAIRRISETIQA